MIGLALDTEEQMKRMATGPMGNPNQVLQAAPIRQGISEQMGDMMKKKLMSDAVETGAGALTTGLTSAGTSALGGSAMAGIGTAMPYVGAGLLAGKAFGLFNRGGQVGPLSAMYKADGGISKGYNYKRPRYSPSQGIDEANLRAMQDKKDLEEALMMSAYDSPVGIGSGLSADYFIDTPYSYNRKTQYKAEGGMTTEQAMALMNNQPDPNQLYDEIVAESMTEAAQQQMPMPKMRPPLAVDPMDADTTSSPYAIIRLDNAPNT